MRGETMTRKRFEYKKMTAAELEADLNQIGMPVKAFARISGSSADRVRTWVSGEEDIPTWVPVFTAMLKNVPGAIARSQAGGSRAHQARPRAP